MSSSDDPVATAAVCGPCSVGDHQGCRGCECAYCADLRGTATAAVCPHCGKPVTLDRSHMCAPLTHTPIPSCEDPSRPACLACTDAADRCVPWPCGHAPPVAFTDVVEGCTCDECMEGEPVSDSTPATAATGDPWSVCEKCGVRWRIDHQCAANAGLDTAALCRCGKPS